MVGRAKSTAKKQHEESDEKAELQRVAVNRYCAELEKPAEDRRGARRICEEVEIEHKNETGRYTHLNHATIIRHANGGKLLCKFNAEKCWLSGEEEEEVVLAFAEETAVARLGPTFKGVGEGWTDRFILRHSKHIQTIWSSSLEGACAGAANPTNNKQWFELLGEQLKDVNPDCIWAADETGIQTGAAVHQHVIGKKGALYTFPPISRKFTRNYKEFTRNDFHSWSFLVRAIWQRIPAK
ncbi:hypothetical protein M378DRAFT_16238 [Amanita muscaria Koide BX008]|uniref:Uncharacterized protein n=1 Tax=Amanita muscaria (strain Koide BX008) TaxID=946122 RepID=A0A0C2STU1_AMAMK|nr:hypothetical protein M378DRAFT_16238 [Amanita muscaria Koide BX008]